MDKNLKLFRSLYPAKDDIGQVLFAVGYFVANGSTKEASFAATRVNAAWWAWEHQQKVIQIKRKIHEQFHVDLQKLQFDCNDKQKRIDELQSKLSEDSRVLHNVIDIERTKCEKLQARVDAAQKLIQQWRDVETYSDDCANELEQALNGDGIPGD